MRYALLAALLLPLAACDTGHSHDDDDPQIAEVLFTEADGSVVAYSHGDHWHGTLRTTAGQTTTLDAWLVMEEDHDHDHDDDHDHDHDDHGTPEMDRWARPSATGMTLRITSDNEAVATWSGTGDVVSLTSTEAGAALTTIVVLDGSTTMHQSPPVGTISDPAPPTLSAK